MYNNILLKKEFYTLEHTNPKDIQHTISVDFVKYYGL